MSINNNSSVNYIDSDPSEKSVDDLLSFPIETLSMIPIYCRSKLGYMARHLTDSVIVVDEIVKKIKKKSANLLITNYINTKLPNYSIEFCHELIDYLIVINETDDLVNEEQAENALFVSIDEEPEPAKMDTWTRTKVISSKKEGEKPEMPDFAELQRNILGNDREKLMIAKVNEKAYNYIAEIKEKFPPQPIDLNEILRTTEDEEELRNKKENEQRIINEKKEKEKMKENEIKHQQIELAKMAKEQKAKNFTYDYDGKVILVHGIKSEKFPPPTYSVNFAFSQDFPLSMTEEEKKKLKKKKQQDQLKEARLQKHKKTPEEEKDFVKNIVTATPPVFDHFILNPGVTLNMDGKLKMEPRPITATMENLTDPTIRMSKTDYYNLTRGGNLSREGLSKTENTKKIPPITNKLGNISEEGSYQTESKDLLDLKAKDFKKKIDVKIEKIKVTSPILVKTLQQSFSQAEDNELKKLETEYLKKKEDIQKKKDKAAMASPIDRFNIEIISSKDWGRSTMGSNASFKKGLLLKPNNKDKDLKSLNITIKKPRERGLPLVFSSSQNSKYLPPPMIGRTIGHGFYNSSGSDLFKLPDNI